MAMTTTWAGGFVSSVLGWRHERGDPTRGLRELLLPPIAILILGVCRIKWRTRNRRFVYIKCGNLDIWAAVMVLSSVTGTTSSPRDCVSA